MLQSEATAVSADEAMALSSPSTSQQPPVLSAAALKVVSEARKKFNTCMENELLDYKHNHAMVIESCAGLLIKIFSNILDSPDEEKYRQVKSTSAAFKQSVSGIKGGENLLTMAGFHTKIIDLVKFWAWEPDSIGVKAAILRECREVLQKALGLIHEKAERKRREGTDKERAERERREAISAQMEDDKKWRQMRADNLKEALAAQEKELRDKEALPPPVTSLQESSDAAAAAALHRLNGGGEEEEANKIQGQEEAAEAMVEEGYQEGQGMS